MLVGLLIALGGWSLSRTFELSTIQAVHENQVYKIERQVDKIQDQKDCKKKMIEGMEIRKEKNQPYNGNEVARIIADCDYDEDYCYLCLSKFHHMLA